MMTMGKNRKRRARKRNQVHHGVSRGSVNPDTTSGWPPRGLLLRVRDYPVLWWVYRAVRFVVMLPVALLLFVIFDGLPSYLDSSFSGSGIPYGELLFPERKTQASQAGRPIRPLRPGGGRRR